MPELVPFPVDRADITPYYEALARALDGSGPALAPYDAATTPPPLPRQPNDAPQDLALVVSTSGSTGAPKRAMLTRRALIASATATHERIGAGTWLLPLPPHHIAGTQVIVRSIVAGTTPTVLPQWSLGAFVKATTMVAREAPPFSPVHTSLVPTQLRDLLTPARPVPGTSIAGGREDDSQDGLRERALAAARRYRTILVGGAATPARLQEEAREAGLAIVTTYGSSESAGGCVYDGRPLAGVTIRLLDAEVPGADSTASAVSTAGATGPLRVALTGPVLASGYLDDPARTADAFVTLDGGERAFRTDDLGHLEGERLVIDGRVDDAIVTGGYKVSPHVVEDAVRAVPGVRDAVVVARADERWGQAVAVAVVTDAPGEATDALFARLLDACRKALPPYAVPRFARIEPTLPLTGVGKPDRAVVASRTRWQNLR